VTSNYLDYSSRDDFLSGGPPDTRSDDEEQRTCLDVSRRLHGGPGGCSYCDPETVPQGEWPGHGLARQGFNWCAHGLLDSSLTMRTPVTASATPRGRL
jgi:hypothetical protein